ncbi:MAG TPA: DinB family protein [Candidatus Limnocylindrales bacterium]|nr:DinB family protein [Candidatus Limnocylindrales bacterium]
MTLVVTDDPPDRPAWVAETLRLVTEATAGGRDRILARVAAASDPDLVAGTDEDWGLGQIAVHLLLIERGVALIALRLAKGEAAGRTGQPRPAPSSVTREGIATLAAKTTAALAQLRAEFPAEPNMTATARHPYYGELNAFGWLLTLGNHYSAHLGALERGMSSAL